MTFDFYIFGTPNGMDFEQSPSTSYSNKFQQFAQDRKSNSQLIVFRDNSLFYYIYIRGLSETTNEYFGICLIFNGVYCKKPIQLFNLFDKYFANIVQTQEILRIDKIGEITFTTDKLRDKTQEINRVNKLFQNDNFFKKYFDSVDGTFTQNIETVSLAITDNNQQILDATRNYNCVHILGIEKSDSDLDKILKFLSGLQLNTKTYTRSKFEQRIISLKKNNNWLNWVCGILSTLIFLGLCLWIFIEIKHVTFWSMLFVSFLFVISIYFLMFNIFTEGKQEMYFAILSFIFSILGIVITLDESVFSQSDGKYFKIIERCFEKNNLIDISEEINKCDTMPNLIYVLDVSGTVTKKVYENQNEAEELFNIICNSNKGSIENIEETLSSILAKKNAKFTVYSMFLLKILSIIDNEKEKYKDRKFDIVYFADNIEGRQVVEMNTKSTINAIRTLMVTNKEFINDKKTDFIVLLDSLSKMFGEFDSHKKSKIPKYSFMFFSDYIYDLEKSFSEKEKNKKLEDIKKKLIEFYSTQNFSNFFFLEKNNNNIDAKPNEIDIFPTIRELTDEKSKAHFVRMSDTEYTFLDLLSSEPIPLYYQNSYSKEDLQTKITFNNIRTVKNIKLSINSKPQSINDFHYQFSIFDKDLKQVYPSEVIHIDEKNPLIISFSGRIIEHYSYASLNIISTNRGSWRFDIVFFKDLPFFAKYIITFTMIFMWFCLLSFLLALSNHFSKGKTR